MKFKCIKGFALEKCDADGFIIENEYVIIEEESIWETEDVDADFIILYRVDSNESFWLEIPKDLLDEEFEQLKQ